MDKYLWTGHAVLMGKRKAAWQSKNEVLERFGRNRSGAIKGYRQFIEDGWHMGRRDDLRGGGIKRSVGGWEGIAKLKRNKEYWRGDEQILVDVGTRLGTELI